MRPCLESSVRKRSAGSNLVHLGLGEADNRVVVVDGVLDNQAVRGAVKEGQGREVEDTGRRANSVADKTNRLGLSLRLRMAVATSLCFFRKRKRVSVEAAAVGPGERAAGLPRRRGADNPHLVMCKVSSPSGLQRWWCARCVWRRRPGCARRRQMMGGAHGSTRAGALWLASSPGRRGRQRSAAVAQRALRWQQPYPATRRHLPC